MRTTSLVKMHCGSVNEHPRRAHTLHGFTLVETLVAGAVLLLILGLTLVITSNLTRVTSESTASLHTFQEARTAFETMNRMLSQAVLNTYWDYDNPGVPKHYLRASELHFVLGPATTLTGISETAGTAIFCQAPLSMATDVDLKSQPDLLNTIGFYVRFSTSDDLPNFLSNKKPDTAAWRLWMLLQPTEDFSVYDLYNGQPQAVSNLSWFQNELSQPAHNHILANHVILLLIRAGYSNASEKWQESYIYNSRGTATPTTHFPQAVEVHQIPPVLNITMVAIDRRTADRLLSYNGGNAYHLIPENLFSDVEKYQDDMKALQQHLNDRPIGGLPIHYRVFETVVNPASSKWSR